MVIAPPIIESYQTVPRQNCAAESGAVFLKRKSPDLASVMSGSDKMQSFQSDKITNQLSHSSPRKISTSVVFARSPHSLEERGAVSPRLYQASVTSVLCVPYGLALTVAK